MWGLQPVFAAALILSSCGAPVGTGAKVVNLPDNTAPLETTGSPSVISPGFGQSLILAELEKRHQDIIFISKNSGNLNIFSMSDGSAFIYDETNETLVYKAAPLPKIDNKRSFLLTDNFGWRIGEQSVEQFKPKSSKESENSNLNVVSASFNTSAYRVAHISKETLVLISSNDMVILDSEDNKITAEAYAVKESSELSKSLSTAIAVGFGPKGEFLWLASKDKVRFFTRSGTGFSDNFTEKALNTGISESAPIEFISFEFDENKNTNGKIIFLAEGRLYVSGSSLPTSSLSWETDIRPIAEQRCVSCHGQQGVGGFSNADQAIAWTGVKRNSIVSRVYEQKTMPPSSTPAAAAMSEEERNKINIWLSGESNASNSRTPSGSPIASTSPTSQTPTPGLTWTNEVKQILGNRCSRCHTTYTTFDTVYTERARIIARMENGSMPQANSEEAKAMSQAEKDKVLGYLKSFPQ